MDNEGFTSQNTKVSTYAYLAGNRMAVTIWNPTDVPQKPVITAKGYTLESANWQNPALTGTGNEIQPGDIALFVFK